MDYSQIVSALEETTIDYTSYFNSLIANQATLGDGLEMLAKNQEYIMEELVTVKECINTSSSLIVGLILFIGILAGILLGVILWRM